jgi:hypothetical protein
VSNLSDNDTIRKDLIYLKDSFEVHDLDPIAEKAVEKKASKYRTLN